jgi:phosphoglycerate dehydrogenase-like enzyme
MIAVSVPTQEIADALGDLGPEVRVIVWDPNVGDIPEAERERVTIACVPHYSGGKRLYDRLAKCPRLKVIQIPSAGYEHAAPFVPAGVALANARGVHDTRTAEMAVALALASQRLLPQFFEAQRRGRWEPVYYNPSLADRKALVVGYGGIGAAIGRRLRAMEVDVTGVGRTARVADDGTMVHAAAELPRLLPGADIVFIATPHNDATDKLVNASFLAAMRDGALLVNVGRGKCVDTPALLAELQAGRLRAALDVTDPEPLPADHPLWRAPGCIIVPHVAGGTELTNRRYVDLVRRQVDACRRGEGPVNCVMMGGKGGL